MSRELYGDRRAGWRLARTLSVPVRGFTGPGPSAHGHMTDGEAVEITTTRLFAGQRSINRTEQAVCKTAVSTLSATARPAGACQIIRAGFCLCTGMADMGTVRDVYTRRSLSADSATWLSMNLRRDHSKQSMGGESRPLVMLLPE